MTIEIAILEVTPLNDSISQNWEASYTVDFKLTVTKHNQITLNFIDKANLRRQNNEWIVYFTDNTKTTLTTDLLVELRTKLKEYATQFLN